MPPRPLAVGPASAREILMTGSTFTGEEAKGALDELERREVAELDFTEDGVLFYTFHEAKYFKGEQANTPKRLTDG